MQKIAIGENSWFIGEEIRIGQHVTIGKNTTIRASLCILEDYSRIGENNSILVEGTFHLGNNGFIGNFNNFTAREILFGDYLFLDSNVMIGHGGRFSYDSFLKVGKGVMICAWVPLPAPGGPKRIIRFINLFLKSKLLKSPYLITAIAKKTHKWCVRITNSFEILG